MKKEIVLLLMIFTLGCKDKGENIEIEYYTDGSIKTKTVNNKENITIFSYYPEESKIKSILKKNDSIIYSEGYYYNGQVKVSGTYDVKGRKIGKWSFFDKSGLLTDIYEYSVIDSLEYLNQRWILDKKGDTIGGNYYELTYKDSVNQSEANRFHFFLKQPLLSLDSESFILIPKNGEKIKENFRSMSNIEWDTIKSIGVKHKNNNALKSRNHDIILDVFSKEKGINHLRGVIVERVNKQNNSIDFKTRDIYFNIEYFVK